MTRMLRIGSFAMGAWMLGACAASTDEDVAAASGPPAALAGEEAAHPGHEADHGQRHAARMERRIARMKERLELTDEQVEMIRPIFERARGSRAALRELPREERCAARQALRAQVRSDLEGVLTPEQMEKAERMLRRHGRRHGRRGPC